MAEAAIQPTQPAIHIHIGKKVKSKLYDVKAKTPFGRIYKAVALSRKPYQKVSVKKLNIRDRLKVLRMANMLEKRKLQNQIERMKLQKRIGMLTPPKMLMKPVMITPPFFAEPIINNDIASGFNADIGHGDNIFGNENWFGGENYYDETFYLYDDFESGISNPYQRKISPLLY